MNLIKKYIAEHHTKLNVDKLSKAIEAGIKKGQLERITGQGRGLILNIISVSKDSFFISVVKCSNPSTKSNERRSNVVQASQI